MDHVAIVLHKGMILEKILSGEKTIYSRWLTREPTRYPRVDSGETIYFKDSRERDIYTKATAVDMVEFHYLTSDLMKKIIEKYGKQMCIDQSYLPKLEGKNYCTLIFLEDTQKITPFHINKKEFGRGAAWIHVDDIRNIISS
jgi:hypothetical protein